jgi:hypothetical protein
MGPQREDHSLERRRGRKSEIERESESGSCYREREAAAAAERNSCAPWIEQSSCCYIIIFVSTSSGKA